MAQNIYDREDFYSAYIEHIDRSDKEADLSKDPAWTRISPMLPPVKDKHVLDLGCGTGWFARWAMNQGAKSVLAVDISEKMLARAKELTSTEKYPQIEYRREDLDQISLPESDSNKYGLVFSSLTLHYLSNLDAIMSLVERVLSPGGSFVFNVEHPVYTAPFKPAVVTDPANGEKSWNLNYYYKEGERVIDWLAKGVRKQHRTVTTYMASIFKVGLEVTGFVEFLPTDEELEKDIVDEIEGIRPLFLMMSVRKRV
ncbi:methyltransferase type 11 [Pochonia chlamydosporia 170]|uniref:Methyltransferase type 11 n=1 Tax=Pochonia chlamydosporia 170 TaxID=1380566 RepID=A0A179F3K3_METCM|nr:methyltransferase type 11 [Pochonia chlamydosporia 170]OAQ59951.1 methyltransferase type 11 [Pochonia chlamydosporia 170]